METRTPHKRSMNFRSNDRLC